MELTIGVWVLFNLFVLALLALDLGVFHRRPHQISTKEAAKQSALWVGLALSFNLLVYFWLGKQSAFEFLTGYLIEKALSVDNLFVFIMIFTHFQVPKQYHHRVLFWGVVGALLMRGLFIVIGSTILARYHWAIYPFGAFLVFTGIRMVFHRSESADIENNAMLKLAKRFLPVTNRYDGPRFFTKEKAKWMATPLLLVLVLVESTDLVFALDSIPAIFAVTQKPFIVYTSNVFAILGLRALYFLLADIVTRFRYLKAGLSLILVIVGSKMLISGIYKVPIHLSLVLVLLILGASVIASLVHKGSEDTATGK